MKPKFIDYYMKIAEVTANLSYAKRLQVGAVIVKDNQILATGYNGMPSGWENVCEYEEEVLMSELGKGNWLEKTGQLKTKPEVLHAEMNSLMKVAKSNESTAGATLFCTHAPCLDCAKASYQAGIQELIYKNDYRSTDGINFLKLCGVNVQKYHAGDK
jgi:dCMP deaminase